MKTHNMSSDLGEKKIDQPIKVEVKKNTERVKVPLEKAKTTNKNSSMAQKTGERKVIA